MKLNKDYVKKSKLLNFLFLHFTILIYTGTSILSKTASNYDFLSFQYITCFFGMFCCLGVYAILWQQAIKNFQPSVAYSNKSVTTIWVLIFSALIFNEGITVKNIIGTVLIILGVVLVSIKDE